MTVEPLTATVYIGAPPARVYEFFTRADALVTWMGGFARLDPVAHGAFEVDIKGTPVRGQFLHLDPPHRLVISWGYAGSEQLPPGASTVEVRLVAEGEGTRVNLRHTGLPQPELRGHIVGWDHYLARLRRSVDGEPCPDPGMPSPGQDATVAGVPPT